MKIPFYSLSESHFDLEIEMQNAMISVLRSNWFVGGSNVSEFENEYSSFNETTYTIATSNGLDAIFLALKALGIGKNDRVIVPSNTFIATALAVKVFEGTITRSFLQIPLLQLPWR